MSVPMSCASNMNPKDWELNLIIVERRKFNFVYNVNEQRSSNLGRHFRFNTYASHKTRADFN